MELQYHRIFLPAYNNIKYHRQRSPEPEKTRKTIVLLKG